MKNQRTSILYITYLGILEPIPQSQVLPYLLSLYNDVKIYLLSFEKKEILRNNKTKREAIEAELISRGIRWIKLNYHKRPRVLSSFFDILVGILVSLFLIIRHKISIIHARSNIPIAIGFVLKMVVPFKLLYDRRGIMGEDHTEHSGWKKGSYLYRLAIWFERKAIQKSDAIVVLTQRVNDQLKKSIDSCKDILIRTIPCCIDLKLFKYDDKQNLRDKMGLSGKFVLIYTGSVGTYNLLNEIFDFFKEALEMIPNAHFLILTQNKDIVINLLMRREDIDKEKVTVTYVPQNELPYFLSMGDAGLVFRRTSPTAIAASPTKFGEYLACELPVISTPQIGDLGDIINSNKIGVVLDGYGKTEYKKAVDRLLSLLVGKEEVKRRCRRTAEENFSLERGAHAYLNIYNYLINS